MLPSSESSPNGPHPESFFNDPAEAGSLSPSCRAARLAAPVAELARESELISQLRILLGPFASAARLTEHLRAVRGKVHWAANRYLREDLIRDAAIPDFRGGSRACCKGGPLARKDCAEAATSTLAAGLVPEHADSVVSACVAPSGRGEGELSSFSCAGQRLSEPGWSPPEWSQLPDGVLEAILLRLPADGSVLAALLACSAWAAVGHSDSLWRALFERRWGRPMAEEAAARQSSSLREGAPTEGQVGGPAGAQGLGQRHQKQASDGPMTPEGGSRGRDAEAEGMMRGPDRGSNGTLETEGEPLPRSASQHPSRAPGESEPLAGISGSCGGSAQEPEGPAGGPPGSATVSSAAPSQGSPSQAQHTASSCATNLEGVPTGGTANLQSTTTTTTSSSSSSRGGLTELAPPPAGTSWGSGSRGSPACPPWRAAFLQQLREERAGVCPKCRAAHFVPIVYGFPSPQLVKGMRASRCVLGGDHLTDYPGFNPIWTCLGCGTRWRKYPYLPDSEGGYVPLSLAQQQASSQGLGRAEREGGGDRQGEVRRIVVGREGGGEQPRARSLLPGDFDDVSL